MSVKLSEVHNKLINSIGHQNGLTDFELETRSGSEKGDNYVGDIKRVTLKSKDRKLELILKSAGNSDPFQQFGSMHDVFHREIYLYDRVFEEFNRFQELYNISDPFKGFAKLYGHCEENGDECLVMENMVECGYRLWDRKKPMNSGHITAVFLEYAKFHSISLAMGHKRPDKFKELTDCIKYHVFHSAYVELGIMDNFLKVAVEVGIKAVEDDPGAIEVLRRFEDKMENFYEKYMSSSEWNLVVCHGDNWCNNFMFEYKDTGDITKPSRVCILDWQISQIGSPALDLATFFLMHSPKEILKDYRKYLNIYHDAVSRHLKEFGCDSEDIFPFSLLEKHWNSMVKVGLFVSLMVIKVMYRDSDEIVEIRETLDSGHDFMQSLSLDIRNLEAYNQRIKDLVEFVDVNNFI